jgi:hypothetical protein
MRFWVASICERGIGNARERQIGTELRRTLFLTTEFPESEEFILLSVGAEK